MVTDVHITMHYAHQTMQEELRQAADKERALEDAAAAASTKQHILLREQVEVARAEMAATFERELEARRYQMENLQSAVTQQNKMTSEVAGRVDKSVAQVSMRI